MESRVPQFWNALPGLALCLLWLVTFVYPATPLDGTVWCVWRRILDLSCPGCGLTRSFVAMSGGSFSVAAEHHLAGPPLYMAMVWCGVFWTVRQLARRPRLCLLPARMQYVFWSLTGGLFLAQTIRVVLSWGAV